MIGSNFRHPRGAKKLLFLLALFALPSALSAQGRIDRELGFVRALAREMRFVGLANDEVTRLAGQFKNAGDQDRIQQIAIEISLYAAKFRGDRAAQRASYKEALDRSKDLLDRTSDAAVQREARATLANAAREFGQFLIEELDIARNEDPEHVKELEAEAGEVFRRGVEACNKVMQDLQGTRRQDENKNLEYGLMWLAKGVLQREHGRAVPQDRDHLVQFARTTLEDLVLDYGEETALGLRGLFEIAQCDEVLGRARDAVDSYRTTIGQIVTALKDADKLGLSAETASFLFDMMQEVYSHLAELLFEQGDTAAAEKLFSEFRQQLKDYGEKGLDPLEVCHPRFGHLVFLVECRFMAESGNASKVQQALEMAQKINDKHPSSYVGIKAKAVLRSILEAQQSLVSGALLFEIALGEFQNKNYEEAVKGFRRAIAAMSPAEAARLGLKAYDYLGRAYRTTDRLLESVIAFQIGLDAFGRRADGTEADDASDVADKLDQTLAALRAQTRNDPALRPLIEASEPLVLAYSVGGGSKIHYKNGNNLFVERKFDEAVKAYQQVTKDFIWYELAQARIAKAYMAGGALDRAMQTVTAYRNWLSTSEAVLDPKRNDKAQVRKSAIREMDYTEAIVAYVRAYGDRSIGVDKDLTKYPAAIEKLRAFVANYGKEGEANVPQAIDSLGRLHTDLGELDKAGEAYAQLKQVDEPRASRLATVIFAAHLDKQGNLQQELDAAASAGKPTDRIEQELKTTRTQLTSLGIDYMRSSQQPQLGILVNTMNALEKLEDWKRVDEVAQRALHYYGKAEDAETKLVIDLSVRPRIGLALLQTGQFQQAYEMLAAAEEANPNHWEVKRLMCQALGGWFSIGPTGRGQVQPALGRFKEAYDKFYAEVRTYDLRKPEVEDYSLEWYRFHWTAYWYARQAGAKLSDYKTYAETLYRKARSTDNFARLQSYGAEGRLLAKYFEMNRP